MEQMIRRFAAAPSSLHLMGDKTIKVIIIYRKYS